MRYSTSAPLSLAVNLLLAPLTDKQSLTTRLDKAQILLEADEFVTRYNLHDSRDSIRKGALLAYDPHDYARIDGLTDAEITALQNDKVELRESKALVCCVLAGVL
ncbi:hypothetical protein ABHI18_001322 [Aspergillus niger]